MHCQPSHGLGHSLRARKFEIASSTVARLYARRPELEARYAPNGREKCVEDVSHHLMYLAEALSAERPGIFEDYILWARSLLENHGVRGSDFVESLEALRDELLALDEPPLRDGAQRCIDAALKIARGPAKEPPCRIDAATPLGELAVSYLDALLRGDRASATALVMEAVNGGLAIPDVYLGVFEQAQHELGRLWQLNRVSVAQEHLCTAATQMVMSLLAPRVFSTPRRGVSAVCACVGGDLHELGARMVSDMLELDGWDAYYLGANTPTESVVREAASRSVDVVAISATMPYHVSNVAGLIAALRDEPATRSVRIIVGGRVFNQTPGLWLHLGADATARDAAGAVDAARASAPEEPA